jgi:hypothetical protein
MTEKQIEPHQLNPPHQLSFLNPLDLDLSFLNPLSFLGPIPDFKRFTVQYKYIGESVYLLTREYVNQRASLLQNTKLWGCNFVVCFLSFCE